MPSALPFFQSFRGLPGMTVGQDTFENSFIFGEPYLSYFEPGVIDSAARDAGNSTTTVLRKGLLLSKDKTTGKYLQWTPFDQDEATNYNTIDGVLLETLDVTQNEDRVTGVLTIGNLKAEGLIVAGAVEPDLTGNDYRYLVARQLAPNFRLDTDDLLPHQGQKHINANITLTDEEHGLLILSSATGGTATLPAPLPGLEFSFAQLTASTLTVATAGAASHILIDGAFTPDLVLELGEFASFVGIELSAGEYRWLNTVNIGGAPTP